MLTLELMRGITSLAITWLKDKSLADLDNLPNPDVLAEEIAENLENALASFQQLAPLRGATRSAG